MSNPDQTEFFQSEHSILSEIDKILNSIKPYGIRGSDWVSQRFEKCYKRYEEITDQMPKIANKFQDLIAKSLFEQNVKSLSICSLACGDGELDYLILSQVVKAMPDINIHWTGIDINPTLCEQARAKLEKLPIEIDTRGEDIDQLNVEQIRKADFTYMIHGHYFFPSLKESLNKILELKKPGTSFVFVSAPRTEYNQLYTRFWRYEHEREFWHTQFLLPELEQRGLVLHSEQIQGTMDVSRCFQEGWDTLFGQEVLDFLCHTTLDDFPLELRQLAIAYIDAISIKQQEKRLLKHPCDVITIN